MLHNIPAILPPELLHTLAMMGHGDDLVIADANFPAQSMGARVIRCEGSTATDICEAVLKLLPLDTFVDDAARVMEVVGDPDAQPEVVTAFQRIINETADVPQTIQKVERFGFYDIAKEAFAVVQTGEQRLYGNVILKKGVIGF